MYNIEQIYVHACIQIVTNIYRHVQTNMINNAVRNLVFNFMSVIEFLF